MSYSKGQAEAAQKKFKIQMAKGKWKTI